jgi:flagellar basal-body rod protein FlgB
MSDATISLLKSLMDGCATRQTVLANNVANANTAGYTRSDVDFKDALAHALADKDPDLAVRQAHPEIHADSKTERRENGNNVSLQRELGMMAENRLLYDLSAQALTANYSRLREAIRGQ